MIWKELSHNRGCRIPPRKQTVVVHANQCPGNNSLGGWEIPHYELAAVAQTDHRPGKKRDLPYSCCTSDQALGNNRIDMLMVVRTRCHPR